METEGVPVCFYKQRWRSSDVHASDEWQVVHYIVVPKVYHKDVLSIVHYSPMAGHLGVRNTRDRILNHFWWPTKKNVSEYCRSCYTCQVVGKPNQKIPAAPLKPIPGS